MNKSKQKRVSFSALSSLYVYNEDEDESVCNTDLCYSEQDYGRFREDTSISAHNIRALIKEKNTRHDTSMTSDSPSMQYIKSYKRLRRISKDNVEIVPEEMIGLEHLVIGRKMTYVNISLRSSSTKLILDEQHHQREELGIRSVDPTILADVIMPLSHVSAVIAHSRAKYIAKMCLLEMDNH